MKHSIRSASLIILLVLSLSACHSSKNKSVSENDKFRFSDDSEIYVSEDGVDTFEVNIGLQAIKVTGKNTGEVTILKQVPTASGAKYSNDEGYSFWNKGNEFMWIKNDEVILSGHLLIDDFTGNYVTSEYAQRNEGYDWVAVTVSKAGTDQLFLKVRSRADRKKPSCTWDAIAFLEYENSYSTVLEGKKVLFTFSDDTLSIAPDNQQDENLLYFFCSGGATLAGKYVKINEELDQKQIDPTVFSKVLRLQGIGFNISSVRKEGQTLVTVAPFGLEIDNRIETYTIDGSIVDAEIEDLNADGSPELLIYTRSFGSGSYGNVLAFSVNNRKSVSRCNFPPITQNEVLREGYMGHDEFRIVERYLIQRFPIYNEGDSNAITTGGIRQVSYELVEGEAMRQFKVKEIQTFDK